MLNFLAPAIGAVTSLIAGNKQNKANENARAQEYKQQKEFAESGIQWKVEDAKKAGIHPLYALGANTVSYSPQSVGGTDFSYLADAGQNIGRAIDATRSNPAKAQALATTAAQVQLEGARLDNEYKKIQIASAMATARQASMPGLPGNSTVPALVGMPGQGDTPQIEAPSIDLSKKIAPTSPGQPSTEYGAAPEVAWYKTPRGYAPQIPQALSEPFEQDWPSFYQWFYRNKIAPEITPPAARQPFHKWVYNPWRGEYFEQYDPDARDRFMRWHRRN